MNDKVTNKPLRQYDKRLSIYSEQSMLDALHDIAKRSGMKASPYARMVLLNHIEEELKK